MEGYPREALAKRAGVEAEYVDRLLELGLLEAPTGAEASAGDVRRVRLLRGLEDGGLPIEAIGTAVRRGDLSFRFLDLESWEWYGGFVGKTYRQLSAEAGVDLELLQVLRESMGFARPRPEDPVHEEDLDWIPVLEVVLGAGVEPASVEALMRVWGDSMRRLTEASATFYHRQIEVPLLRAGMSDAEVLQAANEAVAAGIPAIDRALIAMYHAHSEHTWMSNVVETVEAVLEKTGLHHTVSEPPAMSFLDLSGYTHLTEERGDEAAAGIAGTLGRLVQQSALDHGGRAVKWLGDGVMFFFPDPGEAVLSALELSDGVPGAGLPPTHTGIDAGPVVFQDGDYFGRTVNTAARIAAHAKAGETLVSEDVVEATKDGPIRYLDAGTVELNGLLTPIRLYRASR
jgi:adenylate cyclase